MRPFGWLPCYKTLQKDQALADCIQSLLSTNAIERVENVKSRNVEKFKMETPESIRTSLVPGEWVSLTQTSPIPGQLADQVPVSGRIPSEHSGCGRPNPVLVDNKPEKSELKPTQVFSFVGYEYHLHSALVRPTQERWLKLQDLILRLKSKHVLTARCLMLLVGLLVSMEKIVPEGRLHTRPFQFHLKEHWRYPQSLENLLPWTDAISAHLDWWQNPVNVMTSSDLHPKTTVSNSLQMPQTKVGVLT